jgi:hypothetical protein
MRERRRGPVVTHHSGHTHTGCGVRLAPQGVGLVTRTQEREVRRRVNRHLHFQEE